MRRAADRINEALAPAADGKAEYLQDDVDSHDKGESDKTGPASPSMSKASRRRLQQLLSKLTGDKLRRLQGYERQEQLFAGHKSYSKTDPDATTFMRGKHTPMNSIQLRGYYNLQLDTQNQFILGYSQHSYAGIRSAYRRILTSWTSVRRRSSAMPVTARWPTISSYTIAVLPLMSNIPVMSASPRRMIRDTCTMI